MSTLQTDESKKNAKLAKHYSQIETNLENTSSVQSPLYSQNEDDDETIPLNQPTQQAYKSALFSPIDVIQEQESKVPQVAVVLHWVSVSSPVNLKTSRDAIKVESPSSEKKNMNFESKYEVLNESFSTSRPVEVRFKSATMQRQDFRLSFLFGEDKVMDFPLSQIREAVMAEQKEIQDFVFVHLDVSLTAIQEKLLHVGDVSIKQESEHGVEILIPIQAVNSHASPSRPKSTSPKIVVQTEEDLEDYRAKATGKIEWIRALTKTNQEQQNFLRATKRNLFDTDLKDTQVGVELQSIQAEPSISQKSLSGRKASKENLRLSRESSQAQISKNSLKEVVEPVVSDEWQNYRHDDFLDRLESSLEGIPEEYVKISYLGKEGATYQFQTAEEVLSVLKEEKHDVLRLSSPDVRKLKQNIEWIDVEGGNIDEITKLGKKLEMHPLTIEDCTSTHSRQKLEPFENYLFIVFRSLHHIHYSQNRHQNPVKILVFANLVVTFHRYPSFAIQTALEMMKKLHSGSFFKSKYVEQIESMDILHVILDSISDTDRPIVDSLDAELYHLQDFIYESTMSDDFDLMRRMTRDREKAVVYQQLLWPKRDILTYLIQKDYVQSMKSDINATYFRDVYDEVVSMISQLEVVNEVIVSFQNTYLSKIDLGVSDVSNRMGDFVKRLTSFSTIMLPLGLITGLLGMNVTVPFATYMNGPSTAPFWTLMALMALYAGFVAIILHKKDLL